MIGKDPLIILTGPTGVGKSALSIRLAKELDCEIISADSMQVYKGMDIGTAKITKEEACGIRHYGIDLTSPDSCYNVTGFVTMAKNAITEIVSRGKLPLVVGGTGFYIQALLYDVEFTEEETDDKRRKELSEYAEIHGPEALHELLKDIDPISYETIHYNNVKRTIRAIEFYEKNKFPISSHNREQKQRESFYNSAYFVLERKRDSLYENINKRVDLMMEKGLLAEARRIYDLGIDRSFCAMQAIGYKQLFEYFDGSVSLDEAIDNIKKESRHYAKRQLTWFRREKDVIWLEREESDDVIFDHILEILKEREIVSYGRCSQ
ncbi:MAG: tRNA (adenosine(37)-N6)-dimethylallyltransferase MiaA [Lachnospiraceae bacterium]|nr:tRNA (adenosine(37)-N6)-dimethylallyltransferase MiaA [Lachnospiraceae bacterium]